MSYEVYSYKSRIGKPDLDEALEVIESEDSTSEDGVGKTTIAIVKALTDFNPRLKAMKVDLPPIGEEENGGSLIELNPPENDLAIQINVDEHVVLFTIPYWYTGKEAKKVFALLMDYLRVTKNTAGFYAFDSQTEQVFDPLSTEINGLETYLMMSTKFENDTRKPWWKFW